MKKCPVCGLLLRDDAVRCYMCNNVFPEDAKAEEPSGTDPSEESAQPSPQLSLEDEIDAFFADNGNEDPGNIFKRK